MPEDTIESLLEDVAEEDDLEKVIKTLLDPANIHHLTELEPDEITAFTTLGTMATKYDIKLLKDWLAQNLLLRVSKSRKGRSEFVKITQRFADQPQESRRGFFDFRRRD